MLTALAALAATFASVVALFESPASSWRGVRGAEGTRASVLIAYQATTLAGNAYLAAAGLLAWWVLSNADHPGGGSQVARVIVSAAATPVDRLTMDIPFVRAHLLVPLGAHLVSDLVLYLAIPELRKAPALIAHHVMTGVLAVLAVAPAAYCHCYIIFFAGVAELSNVPLAFLELAKLLPPHTLRAACPLLHAAAIAAFGVSFGALRLVCWPVVAATFWTDSLQALRDGHATRYVVLIYLAANAVLTLMQLAWGLKLAQKLRRRLPPVPVASMSERKRRLGVLELSRPRLVLTYRLSCFMYSAVGLVYLWSLPALPPTFRSTAMMSGPAFGTCLLVQGGLSFINDALCTFGIGVPGPRVLWLVADRVVASTLTANAVGTAQLWSRSTQSRAPPELAVALVLSFGLYLPSKYSEITGRMPSFLAFHSLWHYVPCSLAALWILLSRL